MVATCSKSFSAVVIVVGSVDALRMKEQDEQVGLKDIFMKNVFEHSEYCVLEDQEDGDQKNGPYTSEDNSVQDQQAEDQKEISTEPVDELSKAIEDLKEKKSKMDSKMDSKPKMCCRHLLSVNCSNPVDVLIKTCCTLCTLCRTRRMTKKQKKEFAETKIDVMWKFIATEISQNKPSMPRSLKSWQGRTGFLHDEKQFRKMWGDVNEKITKAMKELERYLVWLFKGKSPTTDLSVLWSGYSKKTLIIVDEGNGELKALWKNKTNVKQENNMFAFSTVMAALKKLDIKAEMARKLRKVLIKDFATKPLYQLKDQVKDQMDHVYDSTLWENLLEELVEKEVQQKLWKFGIWKSFEGKPLEEMTRVLSETKSKMKEMKAGLMKLDIKYDLNGEETLEQLQRIVVKNVPAEDDLRKRTVNELIQESPFREEFSVLPVENFLTTLDERKITKLLLKLNVYGLYNEWRCTVGRDADMWAEFLEKLTAINGACIILGKVFPSLTKPIIANNVRDFLRLMYQEEKRTAKELAKAYLSIGQSDRVKLLSN